jgi:hypothetical protein
MTTSFFWTHHAKFVLDTLLEQIEMNNLSYEVTDVTYLNDTCPSLEIKSETQTTILFLPNSWRNNYEEVTTYMLIRDEDYGSVEDYRLFHTLEEFIDHLVECHDNKTNLLCTKD